VSRKNVVAWAALDAVSMATDQTSAVTDALNTDNIGLIVSWTGTAPVGELFIDVTNDTDLVDAAAWTWVPLTFSSNITITGNTGDHDISLNFLPFAKLRVRYARTSGTGTLTVKLTKKQAGG
jgi:hypothetical protein